MANELIINVTLGETRVARLESGVVAELFIERTREQGVLGNIYKGKVVSVLPGMQAAFVDVGLARTAFLHASDVVADGPALEDEVEARLDGDAADADNEHDERSETPIRKQRRRTQAIDQLLREGNQILVQVEKEPIKTKGARLTAHISLPGRYLVYMPTIDHVGASRRIPDAAERNRLRDILRKLRPDKGGFIARTVCAGAHEKDIAADIDYLMTAWKEVEEKSRSVSVPTLVRPEIGVLERVVRDHFTPDVDRLVVDTPEAFERIRAFMAQFMPDDHHPIELYHGAEPIFDHFGIEIEVTRALGQKVWLKSGGYIIIEQTEALTAIDVNTGRFVGRRNVQDTILKTNLEAVREIVYQLRLRNIGGIIILDFIDMERSADRNKVYQTLKDALRVDRARTTISKITDLGLVEMTRERTREDLRSQLTNPCPYCEGKGYLKSPTTVCFELFREICREAPDMSGGQVVALCHPSVAGLLYDEERPQLEDLERHIGKRIVVKGMAEYHVEQFDVSEK